MQLKGCHFLWSNSGAVTFTAANMRLTFPTTNLGLFLSLQLLWDCLFHYSNSGAFTFTTATLGLSLSLEQALLEINSDFVLYAVTVDS